MQIPKSGKVKVSCLVCKNQIKVHPNFEDTYVNIACWRGATVAIIFPGFFSDLDSKGLVIGICDCCLRQSVKEGTATIFYDKYNLEELPMNND